MDLVPCFLVKVPTKIDNTLDHPRVMLKSPYNHPRITLPQARSFQSQSRLPQTKLHHGHNILSLFDTLSNLPQVKQSMIIKNKLVNASCHTSTEQYKTEQLKNENQEISGKSQGFIVLNYSPMPSLNRKMKILPIPAKNGWKIEIGPFPQCAISR